MKPLRASSHTLALDMVGMGSLTGVLGYETFFSIRLIPKLVWRLGSVSKVVKREQE